ncbi:MAG: methylamine dehydrogenase light chain, partial [Steroidobacteraceae bacterium]
MKWLDALAENSARVLARRTSRRSVLGGVGAFLLGATAVPLLPVARGAETKPAGGAPGADPGDPSSCDYWRHCAIDGFLCGCCGGSQTMCPPGTDMSPVT